MKYILSILYLSIAANVFAQDWKTKVGDTVPYFEVQDINLKKISTKDLKGKVILINFFATWCPPCRQELPHVQKELWDKFATRDDFEIIVLGREENWDKITPFVKEYGYTFPFYPDLNRKVYGLFAENTIPRNVVINQSGKIIYQSIGFTEKSFGEMKGIIESQLQKTK